MLSSSVMAKSKKHKVTPFENGHFEIVSGGSGSLYLVRARDYGFTCTCTWGKQKPPVEGDSGCSHILTVFNYMAANRIQPIPAPSPEEELLENLLKLRKQRRAELSQAPIGGDGPKFRGKRTL